MLLILRIKCILKNILANLIENLELPLNKNTKEIDRKKEIIWRVNKKTKIKIDLYIFKENPWPNPIMNKHLNLSLSPATPPPLNSFIGCPWVVQRSP